MNMDKPIYTHEKYTEQNQYWCPESEEFAAASQLLSAIRDGWELAFPHVSASQVWKSGIRPCTIYDFTLVRGGQLMIMPVLSNPYIERFLIVHQLQVIQDLAPEQIIASE